MKVWLGWLSFNCKNATCIVLRFDKYKVKTENEIYHTNSMCLENIEKLSIYLITICTAVI